MTPAGWCRGVPGGVLWGYGVTLPIKFQLPFREVMVMFWISWFLTRDEMQVVAVSNICTETLVIKRPFYGDICSSLEAQLSLNAIPWRRHDNISTESRETSQACKAAILKWISQLQTVR